METIPEYITLHKANAVVSNNQYTWNINDAYYTSTRGAICYVSLVQCCMDTQNNNQILIKYHGSQNSIQTDNQAPIIGTIDKQNFSGLQSAEPVKLLVSARPNKITLQTNNLDNSSFVPTDAVFVLKFEYLKLKTEINNLIDQQYTKL